MKKSIAAQSHFKFYFWKTKIQQGCIKLKMLSYREPQCNSLRAYVFQIFKFGQESSL